MAVIIRAEALSGFDALVECLGGDPRALLQRHGISVHSLGDKRQLLPFSSFAGLLEDAANTLSCPDFALRLSQCWDSSILSPLSLALRQSTRLGDVVECAKNYLFARSPGISLRITSIAMGRESFLALGLTVGATTAGPRRQGLDACLAWLQLLIRRLLPDVEGSQGVCVPQCPQGLTAGYQKHFGALFNLDLAGAALICHPNLFRYPVHSVHAGSFFDPWAMATHGRHGISMQVRQVLCASMGVVPQSKELVADVLGLHPRTLQRRLSDEGTSFECLREQVRRAEARRHLSVNWLPMAQIAALVGVSESSALTRSCRRWFGVTPRQLRSQMLPSEPACAPRRTALPQPD